MYNVSSVIDIYLLNIIFYFSIVSDFIYTHIYYVIIIPSLTCIVVYSGAANRLGGKIATYIGVGAGVATIYTGTKELVKDVVSVFGGDSGGKSTPSTSSTPSGYTPSSSTPSGSTPSGSTPSSNNRILLVKVNIMMS
jgi:hypothetical protein